MTKKLTGGRIDHFNFIRRRLPAVAQPANVINERPNPNPSDKLQPIALTYEL